MSQDIYSPFFGDICEDDHFKYEEIRLLDKLFESDDPKFIALFRKLSKRAKKKRACFYLAPSYAFTRAIKNIKYRIVYEFMRYNKEYYFENAAVYQAAKNNNLALVKNLVQEGMRDNLALKAAYENNNVEMFDFLFKNGMRFREDGDRFKCLNFIK